KGSSAYVEVDGGIAASTAERVCAAGANVLAAGSSVFGAANRAEAIDELRRLGDAGIAQRL
ncbi:MAG: ribulose-phosphate 3-epimerase, partial [Olsenella sp.]|nr:ribulose-phosphate 3-epimerase [Olsenella sp.]